MWGASVLSDLTERQLVGTSGDHSGTNSMTAMKVLLAVSALLLVEVVSGGLLPTGNTGFLRGSGGDGYQGAAPATGYGLPSGGGGGDGQPQPYSFQYEVRDPESGNDYSQQENSDGNVVTGQYQVLLPDGRNQIVKYTASDATGFVAEVSYEGGSPAGGQQGGGGAAPGVYLPPRHK